MIPRAAARLLPWGLAASVLAAAPADGAAQSAWERGRYRNPVTFINDADRTVRINWIYDPAPQVLSTLTLAPGAHGLLPMPPKARLAPGANLQVMAAGTARAFKLPVPLPGQPGAAQVRIAPDLSLRFADRGGKALKVAAEP